MNPFQGISEAERNALDPPIREAVKTFSALDGAFIIREDGVVLAAGRYLLSGSREVKLPMAWARGPAQRRRLHQRRVQGHRHHRLAMTGAVRVFREGEIVLELRQRMRRV